MKKIFTAVLALTMFSLSAQQAMTVKSKITTEGLPAEYAAYGEMDLVTYISGDNFRNDMSSMMMNNSIVYKGNDVTSLSESMGNKFGYKTTLTEMEKDKKAAKKPKLEYTTEKKTIAGYECTKVLAKVAGKDGKENVIVFWVTEALKVDSKHRKGNDNEMDLSELKGYPLGMEMNQSANGMEMKIIMMATEVTVGAVDPTVFDISTEGYNMMSYTEFKSMQKNKGH